MEDRRTRGETGAYSWTKTADGWVKNNIDVAVFQDESIAVGGIVQDSQGRFIEVRYNGSQGKWKQLDLKRHYHG